MDLPRDGDEALRQRVLEAAGALFYARGIQNVGMDDVRAAAGVSLKRLYQLFGSKNDMVAAYLELSDRRYHEGLARHVEVVDDPRSKILAVFDWLAAWFGEDDFRGCAFVNAFGELGATNPAVGRAARRHKQAVRDCFGRLVDAAGGSPQLADHLALVAEGATITAAISGSTRPAAQGRSAAAILVDAELSRGGS